MLILKSTLPFHITAAQANTASVNDTVNLRYMYKCVRFTVIKIKQTYPNY